MADLILLIHLAWIVFMLTGFVLTIRAFWHPSFWGRWLFRSLHLLGILVVALLEILGRLCPLTIWENALRIRGGGGDHSEQFILGLIERLVYPDVDPLVYLVPTYAIALFTMVMFVVKWPWSVKRVR